MRFEAKGGGKGKGKAHGKGKGKRQTEAKIAQRGRGRRSYWCDADRCVIDFYRFCVVQTF